MKSLFFLIVIVAAILVILVALGVIETPEHKAEQPTSTPKQEQASQTRRKQGEQRGPGPASAPAREQGAVLDMMGDLQ
jgi:hypothetical protein